MTVTLVTVIFLLSFSITSAVVRFSVEEELKSALVGNIGEASGLKANYTAEEYNSFRYKFLDQNENQKFVIEESNGNLFTHTSEVLDREKICGFKETCLVSFDIAAYSNSIDVFKILSVEVILVDVNDNSPTFPSNNVTLTILESSIVGSTFSLPTAEDSDSTLANTVESYFILPENYPVFGLENSQPSSGSTLKLLLKQTLDREKVGSYQFKVIARDGGIVANTGTLTINIIVKDFNDNSPVFTQEKYNVSVNEGAGIGHSILRVTATDKDMGENAAISYYFNSKQSDFQTINQLFQIRSDTGDIKVNGNLVYEEGKIYSIIVDAKDNGDPARTGTATVSVTVKDVGNNAPSVSMSFLSPGTTTSASVSEAANINRVIAHVSVVDTDSGSNGIVTCTISSVDFALQVMESNKGYIVVVNRSLDREAKDKYDISITCSDQGTPTMQTSVAFNVTITDENDNKPVFSQKSYYAFVEEDISIGRPITQVTASDADLGRNKVIYYFLDTDAEDKFEINSNTGKISTKVEFDRENRTKYQFTVLAVDSGNPPLTGSATVILTITDANDNAPEFDLSVFKFFVQENGNRESYVGTLSATDKDIGENQKIAFSIKENADELPFVVLSSGVVQTTKVLDREQISQYTFDIIAKDMGTPPQSSSARVVVSVGDENDNAPQITFPNRNNNSVTVSYLADVGSTITKVMASDLDEEGPNSRLIYSIISGNSLDIFSIGTKSGNIYLKRTHPIEEDTTFVLKVSVRDSGLKQYESTEDLTIILKYSNATYSPLVTEASSTNIIITAVVVVMTVIISSVIIGTICVLRRHDKQLETSQSSEKSFEKQMVKVTADKMENGYLSAMDSPRKNKKKEVSFSLDEAYDSMHQDFTSSTTSNAFKEIPQAKESDHLREFQLQQIHLAAKHNQSNFDANSDASCESTNTDSGKGGSDLDMPLHPEETANYNFYMKPKTSSPTSTQTPVAGRAKMKRLKQNNKNGKKPLSSTPTTEGYLATESRLHSPNVLNTAHLEGYSEQMCCPTTPNNIPENWVPSYV